MKDNSVDSIVTDPPYGISFMNKHWDYQIPGVEVWKECLRVLKPGGYALVACGTRTQHRMAVNIEDAGFEIRDVITWLYGSGFPKNLDISKAIDKAAGAERKVTKEGQTKASEFSGKFDQASSDLRERRDAPLTIEAKEWQGWGTALKPACEFWTLARKPLSESTVAKNVLKHGTGGINIDASRVGTETITISNGKGFGDAGIYGKGINTTTPNTQHQGRFPANLILDEEAAKLLDEQTGNLKSGVPGIRRKPHETNAMSGRLNLTNEIESGFGDSGGASRFFYTAKASKSERGQDNNHPTVKPIKLMEYLIRLITPANGLVLDPFCGSGSTGVAAKRLGFEFIGIEREEQYVEIANKRIEAVFI